MDLRSTSADTDAPSQGAGAQSVRSDLETRPSSSLGRVSSVGGEAGCPGAGSSLQEDATEAPPAGAGGDPRDHPGARGPNGRFVASRTAIARFIEKCRHNPATGCVEWIGGKTRGRGKTSWYGSFWFKGRRWTAHRWAARFIHGLEIDGLEIDGLEVDHKCGNTLCVHHLQAVTGPVNRELYWIRVEVGLEEMPPEDQPHDDGFPFHIEPDWLRCHTRSAEPSHEPPF